MSESPDQQPPPAASAVDGLRRAPTHSHAAVLRIRDFRNLWIGLGLSSLGDWMGLLALTARTLRQSEFVALEKLAGVDAADLAKAMLSVDRFVREDASLPVDAVTRADGVQP